MSDHAGGWAYRKDDAGLIRRPWAWSEINGGTDLPQHVSGLCEKDWHGDCAQAPGPEPGEPGTCGCDCHAKGQTVIDIQHIEGQLTIEDALPQKEDH